LTHGFIHSVQLAIFCGHVYHLLSLQDFSGTGRE
jgi:hypothetical protein